MVEEQVEVVGVLVYESSRVGVQIAGGAGNGHTHEAPRGKKEGQKSTQGTQRMDI